MTVSGAIIKWLKEFNSEEFWKMKHIDTDLMHGDVDYALVKEPVQNVKSYLSGKKIITDHYMIVARLPSVTNHDCIDNSGFGEALENWVSEQDKAKNYPQIPDGNVTQIGITTPFVAGKIETGNIVYQMTVAIKYEKER
nr:MAG TPA: Minor capsid protein from bacteriophage [Caudoviricetes sp.]